MVLVLLVSACGPSGHRAEMDTEFENGSSVSEIEVNKQSTRNLTKLGQVWGYIKYYHPAVAAGEFNMDAELFRVLPQVLEARTDEAANEAILDWTGRFGSVREVKEEGDSLSFFLAPDFSWITTENLGKRLSAYLQKLQNAQRPDSGYYVAYDPDGSVRFLHERPYPAMDAPDAGYRLLALYRFWNMAEYFNPNLLASAKSWDTVLSGDIRMFVRSKPSIAYCLNALTLASQVNNTQTKVLQVDSILRVYLGDRTLPFHFRVVNDTLVVVGYRDREKAEKTGFSIGQGVLSAGRMSVYDGIGERSSYVSASNKMVTLDEITPLLFQTKNTVSLVEYYENGDTIRLERELPTYPMAELTATPEESPGRCYNWLAGGVAYLNLGRVTAAELPGVLDTLSMAKGLVLDLRTEVPAGLLEPLCDFLYPESRPFAQEVKPLPGKPGWFVRGAVKRAGGKNPKAYAGRVVVLVNPFTKGEAEYLLMALQQVPGVKTVGFVTAGAQGALSSFPMPGGLTVQMATTTVCYPNGKSTQHPGILPETLVEITASALSGGVDEILEKAVSQIQ